MADVDLKSFSKSGVLGALARWLLVDHDPQWLFGLLRKLWPIVKLPGWVFVVRRDDVQEVLGLHKVFEVPFGENVTKLNGGTNFLLGMSDGEEYRRFRGEVMKAFTLEDVTNIVAPMSAKFTEEIVCAADGKAFDAVEEVITRVPTQICSVYYGLGIDPTQMTDFGRWSIVMSTYLFGNPTNDPKLEKIALAAGDNVRGMIAGRIANVLQGAGAPNTVLERLIEMKIRTGGQNQKAQDEILSYLIGMVTGFVPTNTMAAGHMLDVLLSNKEIMKQTRAAALSGDDDLLKRCLFEAMRFKPLNPGPFRVCTQDYVLAEGTSRATVVRKGKKVLVGTQSAMFDELFVEEPYKFKPDRARSDNMLFGYGLHWCVGAFIAEAQITQMFKVLLRAGLPTRVPGRAGKLARLGPFPQHLFITLNPNA